MKNGKFKLTKIDSIIKINIILVIVIILSFLIFGITFGSLFVVGILLLIVGLCYLIRLAKMKKTKCINRIRNLYIMGLALFCISYIVVETILVANMGQDRMKEELNYVLILGAGLKGDQVSNTLKERLDKGLEYNALNNQVIFIVSGGQGEDELISEAEAMRNYLVSFGVDETRILMEDVSTSTMENIKYSKLLLNSKGKDNEPLILITSDFHIPRAAMIAEAYELNYKKYPSKSPIFVRINYMLREYFAYIKDWITLKFIPVKS